MLTHSCDPQTGRIVEIQWQEKLREKGCPSAMIVRLDDMTRQVTRKKTMTRRVTRKKRKRTLLTHSCDPQTGIIVEIQWHQKLKEKERPSAKSCRQFPPQRLCGDRARKQNVPGAASVAAPTTFVMGFGPNLGSGQQRLYSRRKGGAGRGFKAINVVPTSYQRCTNVF